MIIYKVTNKINNKVYIGQTVKTLEQRKNGHIKGAINEDNTYFHNALKKYGIDNFKWQVICICPNIESLNEQEKHYIKFYNSMEEGYNLTTGGENYIRSEKTKQKISIAQSGKNHPMFGKHPSKKTVEKMRIASIGKNNPMFGKFGKDNPNYGSKRSEETKEKLRQIALNMSDETKKKMSIAKSGKNNPNYGKYHTEETKQKMSIALTGKNHPNYGKKLSNETKQKISESVKKYLENKRK